MGHNLKDYLAYWGLQSSPFDHIGKDATQLFFPSEWQSMLDRLQFFCERSGSLLNIVTEPGHCKTSLAKWLYHSLDPIRHEVLMFSLFQEQGKSGWLVPRLLKLTGATPAADEEALEQLGAAIDELGMDDRVLTILIDEAHKLQTIKSLQDIHSLISIQSMVATRINIVLFGNPDLLTTIDKSDTLRNRISMSATVSPLTPDQIQTYLNAHLQNIGLSPNTISFDALPNLHRFSRGLFSRLNTLVENSLIEAFLRKEKTIHSETVLAAGRFLPVMEPGAWESQEQSRRASPASPSHPIVAGTTESPGSPAEPTRQQSIELKRLFYKSGNTRGKKESAS
ncbi:MAG: AAA family ATPase [Oligoflexus sp.]